MEDYQKEYLKKLDELISEAVRKRNNADGGSNKELAWEMRLWQ